VRQAAESIPAPTPSFATHRFRWHGSGGGLFSLYAIMFLLSMVTVSIYSFWGRTNIRRYIARETELDGDRFDYHGAGKELLIGWLKAMGLFVFLIVLSGLLMVVLGDETGQVIASLLVYSAFLLVLPLAMVGAWRYRFSRTSYRGIRFTFRGKTGEFVRMYVAGVLLSMITLSLYAPIFQNNIRKFLCANTYYGTARFGYDGTGSAMFGKWVVALLLAIPTLGISLVWFWVERFRYYWNHTTFQGARFKADAGARGMVWLYVSNILIIICTLFIGYAWTQARTLRYMLSHLTLEGALSYEQIRQQAIDAGAMGEGFSPWLDSSGIDIGIGL
jgi:uncharacterized membrane protein YjgN (DUF898 family)